MSQKFSSSWNVELNEFSDTHPGPDLEGQANLAALRKKIRSGRESPLVEDFDQKRFLLELRAKAPED